MGRDSLVPLVTWVPLRIHRLAPLLLISLFLVSGCGTSRGISVESPSAPAFGEPFWSHWGDGKAELSAYQLTFTRYGEPRQGTAVAIFVTEPFSISRRVKADPRATPADVVQVMKLNLIRDFSTGIYDYNVMTSSFLALQTFDGGDAGLPVKISFSAQEWCGHVYDQLIFRRDRIEQTTHSYFFEEADQTRRLERREGLSEDMLFLWARGLMEPRLASGETSNRPLLMSLVSSRLEHRPLDWTTARFELLAEAERIEVPAGSFATFVRRVTVEGGVSWTFWIESDPPHRIVRWSSSSGEIAELLGSDRIAYWEVNGAGNERLLERLGLRPRPPRTP